MGGWTGNEKIITLLIALGIFTIKPSNGGILQYVLGLQLLARIRTIIAA